MAYLHFTQLSIFSPKQGIQSRRHGNKSITLSLGNEIEPFGARKQLNTEP